MPTLLEDMATAGLEVLGPCEKLSSWPAVLSESQLLQDFTPAEADELGRLMLHVRARSGQELIHEGDANDWLMLLLAGTVDVGKRRIGADGESADTEVTRLAVLREGAVLGEMSMFDGEPRYASCWALGDVEAAVMDRASVARLIQERPALGAKLLVKLTQLLAQRLRNTSNQLVRVLRERGAAD